MYIEEYEGVVGRLRFFWRFKCVKTRYYMDIVGLISLSAFGLILNLTTIFQWFVPRHEILVCWNVFNEAFIEYLFALVSLPCILFFLKKQWFRLKKR